jgi:hypothetical protein
MLNLQSIYCKTIEFILRAKNLVFSKLDKNILLKIINHGSSKIITFINGNIVFEEN